MKKVVVGLSGGVDSAVSAKLLQDLGYDVLGVFMKNWEGEEDCEASRDVVFAERIAQKLGITFEVVNFSKEYWDKVFSYFLEQNKKGKTPSPDILCNEFIKFNCFLDLAQKKFNAEKIATGHYAKIVSSVNSIGSFELCMAKDQDKDQTYFLHRLNQKQLSKSIFPLADLNKQEVRDLARKWDFPNAEKKDSTGICFIGERNYTDFLKKYIPKTPGNIREKSTGKVLAQHIGLPFYTIGQSKTLGIGGVKNFPEGKWFVVEKNFETNELVVSQDEQFLLQTEILAEKMHWISGKPLKKSFECVARIRHRDTLQVCQVELLEGFIIKVIFKTPVRAVASGQSVVLYSEETCLGGAEII